MASKHIPSKFIHPLFPPQSFVKSFDGTKVHYMYQKNRKECIVFIHGLTAGYGVWKAVYEKVAREGYGIISVDLRGHGYSDKPKGTYTLENAARDIEAIRRKEKIKKFTIVGHCMGSYVALTYYALFPRNVKRLVLISPHFNINEDILFNTGTRIAKLYFRALGIFHRRERPGQAQWNEVIGLADLDLVRRAKIASIASFRVINSFIDDMLVFNKESVAKSISSPLLIIHGARDTFVPLGVARKLHLLVPHSKLEVYEKVNHDPPLNAAPLLTKSILSFVKQ